MENTKNRIRRLGPLIRVRQVQLDFEATQLSRVRNLKLQAEQKLVEYQTKYMAGVAMLNEVRNSSDRQYLSVFESGLDMLKQRWYKTLKALREIEQLERAQIAQVKVARKNIKTMETLKDRYSTQLVTEELKVDLKMMNENAVRRFVDQIDTSSTKKKDDTKS